MSDSKNMLFPIILDILSHKPQFCEAQDKLLKEVNKQLGGGSYLRTDVKKDFESAMNLGRDLGILSVRDENVRMPFSLKSSGPTVSRRSPNKRQRPRSNIHSPSLTRSRSHSRSRSRSHSRRRSQSYGRGTSRNKSDRSAKKTKK